MLKIVASSEPPTAGERRRAWNGPALWSRGFRPFFLAAGLWAVLAVAIWPPLFTGALVLPTAFATIDWHVHEMIFGYGAAVVAGFLLTAIPNWTGRLPVLGLPLVGLTALWALGRAAVLLSAELGWVGAAVLDSAFLLVFAAVAGREVLASRNLRNVKVVLVVLVLAVANICFHLEAAATGRAATAARLGIALLVFLILLIGGRVVPSFTQNWLAKRRSPALPVAFSRPDVVVMVLSGLSLVLWVALPEGLPSGLLLLAAGIANLWRLSRWRGWATRSDRLVLVLHAGYGLAAAGFLPMGAHAMAPDLLTAAVGFHVWAVGAIGTMTLAMMTRATLGHSGQALKASSGTQIIYVAVLVALVARVAMDVYPDHAQLLLYGAALAWIAGFAGFLAIYMPMLTHAHRQPRSQRMNPGCRRREA
jgi:uncharacterized protein involved in response to NO